MPRSTVLAAPDSFKLTASAADVAAAIAEAASAAPGLSCDPCPMSDGGEGFVDVMGAIGGSVRTAEVSGPLGAPVVARWRMAGGVAVVEAAAACGLHLVGGPRGNDPVRASTRGVGELVAAALGAGATRVVVGVGGTATTDGGRGAVDALSDAGWLGCLSSGDVHVVAAGDVVTRYVDAAADFGPQKGASEIQVRQLAQQLTDYASELYRRFGRDVTTVDGGGAGGGLAGALAAVGARIERGARVVADAVELDRRLGQASVVVTGEGCFDMSSQAGKVVGEVLGRATAATRPAVVVAGSAAAALPAPKGVLLVNLTERFGHRKAWRDPAGCVATALGPIFQAGLFGET